MNKAVSRNIRGVSVDAQRAARGAAQRDGKTLGEWLHGAIAEQAEDLGLALADRGSRSGGDDVPSQSRQPARQGRGSASPAADRFGRVPVDGAAAENRDGPAFPTRYGSHAAPAQNEADPMNAAFDIMQRQAAQSDRRTDEALASIAEMMQTSEARRAKERDSLRALTDQMVSLETKLVERFIAGDSPIRGALARVEARLDIIGKRSESRTQHTPSRRMDDSDSVRRLEDKLNSILEAMSVRPAALRAEASPLALRAAQARDPSALKRTLSEAIAEIAERQGALETPATRSHGVEPAADLPSAQPEAWSDTQASGRVQPSRSGRGGARDTMFDARTRLGTGNQDSRSQRLDASGSLRTSGRQASRTGDPALDHIERRLETLAGKVDDALSMGVRSTTPRADTAALEQLVRDLGTKIEDVRSSRSGTDALDALQQQIEILSGRFERSEQGLSVLPTLAASVRELFNHLEATRANIEASAAHAAREVLRIAAKDGRGGAGETSQSDDSEASSRSNVGERAESAALNSVHSMLDQVVERLSSLETLGPVPQRSGAAADSERPRPPRPTFVGVDGARDPIVPLAASGNKGATSADSRIRQEEVGDTAQRADFIAAARRAAKTARSEVGALRRPSASQIEKEARAGLLAKSRDYVAAHKRPLLMAVAALVVALGTMTLLQQTGVFGSSQDIATVQDASPHAQVAELAKASSKPSPAASKRFPSSIASNDLSPSALPRAASPLANPIPGSDPIQTGSIPSLPAFAAVNPSRPMLPAGLVAAASIGNGAAEYDLGARYADGRAVPRDMKFAVKWLEKASDQDLAPAQYRLAAIYEKGLGVPQDKAKAKSLYTQAAEAGNPRAMHNLAVLLADGDGHPDYAGAANWFRRAAGFGVHDSQYNLAILLARGLGVQQSLVQSYQWFAIAGAHDDADAARKRDEVGSKLSANDLALAKAFAAAFKAKTANPAATDVSPPPGGWDGAAAASRINSAKSKVSSL